MVKTVNSSDFTPGVWQQITVFVEGTGANNVLAFQAEGQENSLGALIDNVSLAAAVAVDEDGLNGPNAFGNHDSQPGDIVVPNGDGDNNEATATGLLDIKWGADSADSGTDTTDNSPGAFGTLVQDHPDGAGDRSVTFGSNPLAAFDGTLTPFLTSHGEAIHLSLNADGTILTGTAGTVGIDLRTVFEVSLSDDGSGSFRFVLKDALDHAPGQSENNINLSFNYVATDSDGDTATGTFSVVVNDDIPVANAGDNGSVSEHDLSAIPSFAQDFDHVSNATDTGFSTGNGYGNLAIYASGDGPHHIVTKSASGDYAVVTQTDSGPFTQFGGYNSHFDGGFKTSVDIYLDPNQITSGQGFDYSVAATRQDGTFLRDFIFHVANVGGDLLVGASNNTSFDPDLNLPNETHAAITAAGWYTFQEVFHDAGDGTLAVDLIVRDASGAVVFSQTLNDAADTLANIVGGNRYGWFTNVDVTDGIAIDNVSLTKADAHFTATSFTGSLHESAGADGLASLTFAGITEGTAVTDASGAALKAGGKSVHYHLVDAHTLEGVAQDGHVVFSVTLDPASGNYTFSLQGPVDHPAAETNSLSLNFGYTVTDDDGDSASNSFSVAIADDVPTVAGSGSVTGEVDEDGLQSPDLSTGNTDAGRQGETAGTGHATVTGDAGSLNSLVNFGADGPGAHPFQIVSQSQASTWISNLHLFSQGSAVDHATVSGDTVTAFAHDNRAVFSLTVNDNGSWTLRCSTRSIIRSWIIRTPQRMRSPSRTR